MADQQKHKLLIKPVIKNINWWEIIRRCPIQNRRFSYGVEIENIDAYPFSGGTISQVHITSAERIDLVHLSEKQFNIKSLNPNEKCNIIFGNLYTSLSGIAWFKFYVEASDHKTIEFFQYDKAENKAVIFLSPHVGLWEDTIFIFSQFEHQQVRTNRLLVFLTAITLAQGLWGLKEFVKFLRDSFVLIFYSIWHGIIAAIHFFSNIKHP